MKKNHLIIAAVVALMLLSAWLMNMDFLTFNKAASTQESWLEKDGMECVGIAEKSVANMVAVVEFQKLEILGRKARVMRNCMQDHGYQENPAWTTYATPVAKKIAQETNVSVDEALENLRRHDMTMFKTPVQQPIFWLSTAKNKP